MRSSMRRRSSASTRSRCAAVDAPLSAPWAARRTSRSSAWNTSAAASSRGVVGAVAEDTRARAAGDASTLAHAGRATVMWNNRAMSNRYWISVAAVALAAAVAGVYVARTLSQPAVASLESGTFLAATASARGLRPRGHAGRGRIARFAARRIRRWCSSDSRTVPTCARPRSRCSRACRNRWRCPNLKVALISVDPERDTPQQLGKYICVIRRRSYRPHRQRRLKL